MGFLHAAQQVAPWRLGGGAALAGAWLSHRLSRDLDLSFQDVDPSTFAWLVRDFPVPPMPLMLEPLSEAELVRYRDDLAQRFKRLAVGD